ncbi:MAG: histidine kinase dimerization/phospho-acceptor domain-containing protein, partial [Tissierella sp.]|uniref:histidine kinase dimerization/phospho-acceptor domain-containing protein n=1 Tax=Tissierella sp. TaxID=41274 RepID=UPI003F98A1AE
MKLSKKMILSFVTLIIVSIIIISSISNIMINRSFNSYLKEEREDKFERIYKEVNSLYIDNDFKLDSMELKHLALSNDIIITIKDLNENIEYRSNGFTRNNRQRGMGMHGDMHDNMDDQMQNNDNFIEKSYTLYENNIPKGYLVIGYIDNAYLTDSANLFKNALFRSFIISGSITIIIGFIISFIFSKRLTKPLIMIKNTANKIKEGNLDAASDVDTDIREIIELSNSINFLGATLKNQEGIRRRYALDISHELRTPLTTLQSHLEAIMDGVWDPTKEHLQVLMSETRRLKNLIENLKDSFTEEEYKVHLNKSNFNISKVVKDTITAFLPIYNSKGYSLKYDIEEDLQVFMDKDKIKQIINNLLSNSLRYLKKDGQV